jgi:hypothetical protein
MAYLIFQFIMGLSMIVVVPAQSLRADLGGGGVAGTAQSFVNRHLTEVKWPASGTGRLNQRNRGRGTHIIERFLGPSRCGSLTEKKSLALPGIESRQSTFHKFALTEKQHTSVRVGFNRGAVEEHAASSCRVDMNVNIKTKAARSSSGIHGSGYTLSQTAIS